MSTKQPFIGTVLASLLLVSPVQAQGKIGQGDQATASRNQPAAPIIHRRTSMPAGWFKQGQAAGALTDTQVTEARPAAHFDTIGTSSDASSGTSGAAQRLRRMRESVILDTPPPPAEQTAVPAAERTTSSRRQVETPAATIPSTEAGRPPTPAPLTTSNDLGALPTGSTTAAPGTEPLGTQSPEVGVPTGQDVSRSVTPPSETPDASHTNPPAQDEDITDDASASEPPATGVPGSDSTTTDLIPGVDQLPSVMKPRAAAEPSTPESKTGTGTVTSDLASELTTEPMKLIADDHHENPAVSAAPLTTEQLDAQTSGSEPVDMTSNVLIENESPILSVVTRGPKTMVVGKSANYVVDLSNRSDVPAKDVVVRMNVPQWVEIIQQTTSNGAANIHPDDSGNAVLAWRVDRLNGRGHERLMLELVPRGNRPLDLGVTWSFSPAQSVTHIQVQEPKLQLSVVGPQDVLFGETKVYTITVSNPGTGDAENVVLNLLPLVPGEKTAGVRRLGTVAAGSRQTMEVELTARQTGRLEVRAEVSADGGLAARSQQDVLVRRAALEVQVEGPPMKYAGTRARYVVRVANAGDAPAADVVVSANLPAGAKEVTSSDGGSFDPNAGQIQWHLGALRPGAARVYEFECTLMSPGDNRVDLRSVAAGDLSALGSTVTQVESLADLKLIVNDPQGAVAVGAEVVYEVRITNRGTKAAENIQLFGYFSEGIEPIGITGWKGQLNEGEVVLQSIPRLGAGQEMLLRITAQASRSGDHVFRAELECNEPETKLAIEEWTRFYGDRPPERQADSRSSPAARTPVSPQPLRGQH
jgi:uncharacterized repeat protein (TIGR01451 family)